MKTLILTCASCLLLAGGYIAVTHRDDVKKLLFISEPGSCTYTALPVEQLTESRKSNMDAETSLAPVETLPNQTDALPVDNAVATVIPVANKVIDEVSFYNLIDSNWIDVSVFDKEATPAPDAVAKTSEPVTEPGETKQKSLSVHVPFVEDEIAELESVLEVRKLIKNLNPEKEEPVVKTDTPADVATTPIIVNTAAVVDEESKVVYAPSHLASTRAETGRESYSYDVLYYRAERIKAYAARNGYDTSYAFMIDMGMRSGKKRFFVMDLNTMTIVSRGLVAHGRGSSRFTADKTYSNASGSNCTSLGIYKIGAQYTGSHGLSYRLTGLESTNSNAAKRSIVLHGMSYVPYDETDYPIAQSEGCPSVAPEFLNEIVPIIGSRDKPMLMWIYDPLAERIEEDMVAYY